MVSAAELEKMQARQQYRNLWHVDLMSTVAADCPYCCFACFCGPCSSYLLRKRALYNDMSRYTCCAGYMPCSGRCGESSCPELCLCTEVFCCFANSVASTRFLLQDEFNLQTTKCDNCIIGFMFCLQQVACIFSCIACIVGNEELSEAAQCLNCLSDSTQHKIELDKRDGKFGPQPAMSVPPAQQMSRDQGLPPAVGYPPQPAPGYPPPPPSQAPPYPPPPQQVNVYVPPMQAPGYYPPTAYPPPGYPAPGYPAPGYPHQPQSS
ncbi:hypothetical protein AKJ16_DCAP02604 [Drosera capensis]